MARPLPRILVGVLYSGESQYDRCKRSIESQAGVEIEVYSIEKKPNAIAHRLLYREFTRRGLNYDLLLKVDADMELTSRFTVRDIFQFMLRNSQVSQGVFPVFDFYSQANIVGLHAFKNEAQWIENEDLLFVDHDPVINGEKQIFLDYPVVATHCDSPTLAEATFFGVHRSVKMRVAGQKLSTIRKAEYQYKLLRKVYKNWRRFPRPEFRAVLIGAEIAFRDDIQSLNKDEAVYRLIADKASALNRESVSLDSRINSRWSIGALPGFIACFRFQLFPMALFALPRVVKKAVARARRLINE